ncbi:MAG: universal stress protein [bacterium]
MPYKNILVAVDLTDEATEVLAAAQNVASENSARLSACSIIRPLARTYGGLDMANVVSGMPFEEEMRSQASGKLIKLGDEFGVKSGDVYVRMGSPAAEIRALAEELGADLIVIGTHGRQGLGLLLGSTANAVLHGVGCDVLVVKIHPDED